MPQRPPSPLPTSPPAATATPAPQLSLDTLLNNLPGMAYRCRNDHDWTMEYVSSGCLALTGYSATALTHGRQADYGKLIHPDDRAMVWNRVQEAVQTRCPFQLNYRIIAADGAIKWVWEQGQGVFSPDGALLALEGFIADVTARRQAEDALRANEQTLRALLNAITESVLLLDVNGIVCAVNETAARRIGQPPEAVLGHSIYDFIPPDVGQRRRAIIGQVVKSQAPITFEDERLGLHLVHSLYPVLDSRGQVGQVAIFGRDATLTRQLETRTRQLEKSEGLGRMAGAVAHLFNNYLHAVLGNLELAGENLPPGATVAGQLLGEATQAARRAAEVSGQLLTYLGQTLDPREPLDLGELCRNCLGQPAFKQPPDTDLETVLPLPGPRITASASQVRQLLLLLLTNAWEAKDPNRRHTVRLSVQAGPGPATPGGARHFPPDWQPQPGPYACLEVADTGCGIPPEALDKLFDPFYSTKSTGRGLGLSMALGIVHTHDGAIEVASEPGRGSVFRIYLPAHPNP